METIELLNQRAPSPELRHTIDQSAVSERIAEAKDLTEDQLPQHSADAAAIAAIRRNLAEPEPEPEAETVPTSSHDFVRVAREIQETLRSKGELPRFAPAEFANLAAEVSRFIHLDSNFELKVGYTEKELENFLTERLNAKDIVGALQQTESYAQLEELTQDLKGVIDQVTDEGRRSAFIKRYEVEKDALIATGLSEAGLAFSQADIELIQNEALATRRQKEQLESSQHDAVTKELEESSDFRGSYAADRQAAEEELS